MGDVIKLRAMREGTSRFLNGIVKIIQGASVFRFFHSLSRCTYSV